jgi:sporulation protein YlmC with PRC-barrel domain
MMKKKLMVTALASVLALPFATSSMANETSGASATSSQAAQGQQNQAMQRQQQPLPAQEGRATQGQAGQNAQSQQPGPHIRASNLIGRDVQNRQGQDLGDVEDVLVNINSGEVEYAVLSFGGFLGMGDKLFAFPLEAFDRSQDRDHLVLAIDQNRLENAPGFDRDNWPNYEGGDTSFFDSVRNFFGGSNQNAKQQQAQAQGQQQRSMMRVSDLNGKDVQDRNGRDVGEVKDVVLNIREGKVEYVVLDVDRGWTQSDRLLPVSLDVVNAPRERGNDLVLAMERDRLDISRGFDSNKWPDVNAPSFRRNTESYFNASGQSGTSVEGGTGPLHGPTQSMPPEPLSPSEISERNQ